MASRLAAALLLGLVLSCGGSPPPTPSPSPSPRPPTATPTPAAARQATPAPTDTPAPRPTPSPSPTLRPTPPPGTSLGVGRDIGSAGELLGETSRFPAGTTAVIARAEFQALSASDKIAYELLKDGEEVFSSDPLSGADFAAPAQPAFRWIWFAVPTVDGDGPYRLELYLNDQLAAATEFEIGG